jgi:hypothetical protein
MATRQQDMLFAGERARFKEVFPIWFHANRVRFGSLKKWAWVLGTSVQAVIAWQTPIDEGGSLPSGYFMARILALLDSNYEEILETDDAALERYRETLFPEN